jgi:Ca-activated chloride channel family protein
MMDALLAPFIALHDAFAWPWMLLALPLPWFARWLMPPVAQTTAAALRVPFGDRLDRVAHAGGRTAFGSRAGWLAWLGWALLCVAAARPQELGDAVQPPQAGRDLMLALDLSGSMREPDMDLGGRTVDRLTAAKAVLADFLDRRRGDRVGLIVFGRRAYALTPLTLDLASVRQQLEDSVIGLAGQETAIGDTIALAVKRLQGQPAEQRVLVLLTDGVNTAGLLEPKKAAEIAKAEGVRIHTIAFGGEGTMSLFGLPVPMPGAGDEIDEASLRDIARSTGGRFFRARDTSQLVGIYAEIDRLEPIERPGQAVRPRIERYPWPLGAAFACALLAFAWPSRRKA